jgi:hypothetical protein
MDSSQLELVGSEIGLIDWDRETLRIRFSRALIVKSMTGSRERTRWWQAGDLIMDGAETDADLPQTSCVCAGGDLEANIYTYRDTLPIPLASRGHIRCLLRLQGWSEPLTIIARAVRLELDGVPKYIEHIRP